MNTQNQISDKVIEIGSKVQYTGATGAVVFGLSYSEFGVIAGFAIGVIGYATTAYFNHKKEQRDQEKARREQIEHDLNVKLTLAKLAIANSRIPLSEVHDE